MDQGDNENKETESCGDTIQDSAPVGDPASEIPSLDAASLSDHSDNMIEGSNSGAGAASQNHPSISAAPCNEPHGDSSSLSGQGDNINIEPHTGDPSQHNGSAGSAATEEPRGDLATLSPSEYLEVTVRPILRQGLHTLALERPADPINFMVDFLLKNKHRFDGSDEVHEQ